MVGNHVIKNGIIIHTSEKTKLKLPAQTECLTLQPKQYSSNVFCVDALAIMCV